MTRRRGTVRGAYAAVAALVALGWALGPLPARAADRILGADVAKPAIAGSGWTAAAKARLGADVDALLAGAPTLRGAHVGVLVLDTRSGDELYSRRADDAFMPASTLKLLTGSVALAILGPAFRFQTEAYIARSTLYLLAGGDPLLRADDVRALGRAAFATGEFRFPYPLLVDGSAFDARPYPPGWSWDDFAYDYAAKLTPAPVDENAVELTVSPGLGVGAPLDVTSSSGAIATGLACSDRRALPPGPGATTGEPDSPDTLDVELDVARGCIRILGSLALGAPAQTLAVALPDPAARFAQLAAAGLPDATSTVAPDGPTALPPGARLVWTHAGEPLADLVADMWCPSDNFIAEMLLRAIGRAASGSPGTTEHGAAAERAWLANIGIAPATLTIADGSGLSSYDRITPRALAAILQTDWNGPQRDVVLDDLPLAGVRGTLQHSFAGTLAERRTFAKTGSVNHTRGLAGYLATLHHGAVTLAWSVDDWMGTNADLDALRARVLSRIIGD